MDTKERKALKLSTGALDSGQSDVKGQNDALNSPRSLRSKNLNTFVLERGLYKAVEEGNMNKVISLLERDLDVNWKNEEEKGQTSLHVATRNGNSVIAALLLGKGAEITARDDDNKTPLEILLNDVVLADREIDPKKREMISLLTSKTTSSLEESKRKLKNIALTAELNAGSGQFSDPSPHKSQAQPHIGLSRVDSVAISSQLDQIFETPRSTSIFQSHFPRNSPIIEMLKISHFQTIYNIFIAVLLIAFFNTLLYNYYENGKLLDFELLSWCFGDFGSAVVVWVMVFITSFSAFAIQKAILTKTASPRVAYSLYTMVQLGLYVAVPFVVRTRNYPTATATFVMCELVRLSMKMHSYLMVNLTLRSRKQAGDADPSVQEYPGNVTAENYFTFLWFPTLVYQTSYPRTSNVRWSFVLRRFAETGLCVLYTYAIFARYVTPYLHEMTGSYKELLFATFKVMLPGIAVSLLAFFGILHSWLNAFAEITRFADRHFYSDWWNSTSWGTYYRKWNFVVHKFLHRHIFLDCVVVWNMGKDSAMWITFIISAIVHEYVLAVAFGFYRPILFFMFLFPGVFFIYLTKVLKGSRMWNIFMWTMLIIGHGTLISLYSRAWHFHYYQPEKLADQGFWMSLISIL